MNISTIRITLESKFTQQMSELRRAGLEVSENINCEDQFDECSNFMVASIDSRLIGKIRVTIGPISPLTDWSNQKVDLPVGDKVAELTRGVVHSDYRCFGIFKLLAVETMFHIHRMKCKKATAAIKPDFPTLPFLEKLGFAKRGNPIQFKDWPLETIVQPLICDLQENSYRWLALRDELISTMEQHRFTVDSTIFIVD